MISNAALYISTALKKISLLTDSEDILLLMFCGNFDRMVDG